MDIKESISSSIRKYENNYFFDFQYFSAISQNYFFGGEIGLENIYQKNLPGLHMDDLDLSCNINFIHSSIGGKHFFRVFPETLQRSQLIIADEIWIFSQKIIGKNYYFIVYLNSENKVQYKSNFRERGFIKSYIEDNSLIFKNTLNNQILTKKYFTFDKCINNTSLADEKFKTVVLKDDIGNSDDFEILSEYMETLPFLQAVSREEESLEFKTFLPKSEYELFIGILTNMNSISEIFIQDDFVHMGQQDLLTTGESIGNISKDFNTINPAWKNIFYNYVGIRYLGYTLRKQRKKILSAIKDLENQNIEQYNLLAIRLKSIEENINKVTPIFSSYTDYISAFISLKN